MRTFVLFALALAGTAIVVDDASAGPFRRNRGGTSGDCCGGAPAVAASPCCGGAVGYTQPATYGSAYGVAASTPCCGGSGPIAYSGGYPGGVIGAPGISTATNADGRQLVIQATDGQVYRLGTDGNYYAAGSGISTRGGFTTQPYYGSGYGTPGMYYNGRYMTNGVYPSGYYGGYPSGVYPAGGAQTMPGVTVGPGGITIVPGVMPPPK